jgi:hypothetical protein
VAFFDPGSQSSYISLLLAEKLGLKRGRIEDLHVHVFGGELKLFSNIFIH